jgi:hypothetical protein
LAVLQPQRRAPERARHLGSIGQGSGARRAGDGERLCALAATVRPNTELGGPSALPVSLRARSCDRVRDR